MKSISLLVFSCFLIITTAHAQTTIAVNNARVWTGNAAQPWAEALVTENEMIIYVGSNIGAKKYIKASTKIIDAHQNMVTPGFIDSHVHFILGGLDLVSVQLRDVTSKEMFVQRIADFAKTIPANQWILSGTWDHTLWGGELPQVTWIDAVTPNNPVFISRSDGHMYLANTAAMKQPYADNKRDKGLFIRPLDSIYHFVSHADKAGLQVMVHAIGDDAINKQLDIFERVAKENGDKDRRFRIEHAQHIDPADIPRFAALKIIPSMQPYHAIDDGRWALKCIGPLRAKTTYAFKSLIKAGAKPAFGSDWYVAPPSPMMGIYAAVTRRTLDDKNPEGWIPEQKISLEEALKAYTQNPAFSSFDEKRKDSIEVGKLADFVLLDTDLIKISPEKIREVKVMTTVVGAKVVFEKW